MRDLDRLREYQEAHDFLDRLGIPDSVDGINSDGDDDVHYYTLEERIDKLLERDRKDERSVW